MPMLFPPLVSPEWVAGVPWWVWALPWLGGMVWLWRVALGRATVKHGGSR